MKKKKLIACLLVLVLALCGVYSLLAKAVWNEAKAVHIKSTDIENSTLAIGTHLIHLSALTDKLYEIAQDSASDSGQNNVYYKSELANGAWFDITTASSLKDITTSGTPVADSVIEALFFTYHTKSDGVTYDLRTNQPVNLYDINSPYDLKSLTELMPLKTQYDAMNQSNSGSNSDASSGSAKQERIGKIFETNVKNDATEKCDANLKAIQMYYDTLSKNKGAKEQLDAVQGVMSAEDASRRVQVLTVLESTLNAYSQELAASTDGSDTILQSAVNDSLSNVSASLAEQQGKMLSAGTTVMTQTQYEYSQKLIQDSVASNSSACDTDAADLAALTNIANSTVSNQKTELSFLEGTLLPKATEAYTAALKNGVNADYSLAVQNNSNSAVLKQIVESNTGMLNIYRNELESYLSAEMIRLDSAKAKSFVSQRLEAAAGYYTSIKQDAFAEQAKGTVDEHMAFLKQKLKEAEQGGTGDKLDNLTAKKADLKTQYLSALDENNLTAAKALENQISSVESEIKAEQSERTAALADAQQTLSYLQKQLDKTNKGQNTGTSADKLKAQIAQVKAQIPSLQASLPSNSVGDLVSGLKQECMTIIGKGTPDSAELTALKNDINSLEGMQTLNYKVVFPALQDIHSAMTSQRDLNGSTSFNSLLSGLDQNILDNKSAYDASLQTELTADRIDAIAAEFFAPEETTDTATDSKQEPASSLSENQKQAVFLQALQLYLDKTSSSTAKGKLASLAQQQMNLANPLVFNRLNDVSMAYLPASAISGYTGMRYTWNKNSNQGILARGGTYYSFTVYSNIVQKGKSKEESDKMSKPAKFLTQLYIPRDYTSKTFSVDSVYLTGTNYGVLSSDALKKYAQQLEGDFLAG